MIGGCKWGGAGQQTRAAAVRESRRRILLVDPLLSARIIVLLG
jgi:hypothetical protein